MFSLRYTAATGGTVESFQLNKRKGLTKECFAFMIAFRMLIFSDCRVLNRVMVLSLAFINKTVYICNVRSFAAFLPVTRRHTRLGIHGFLLRYWCFDLFLV